MTATEVAKFFYKSDMAESFEKRVQKLKGVLFQAELGTMYQKVERVQKMAEYLADATKQRAVLKKQVSRAAWLCNADLVSQVVGEFPKLQGVMGRVYALITKEPHQVATAIAEHYRPTYSGGPLPETKAGALLSIADKIDSICGCFSVGLIPTGASDPYALRRQGIGIIQIMLKKGFSFSLKEMIEKSLKLYGIKGAKKIRETTELIYIFLKNRMMHLLAEEGYSKDVIASVTSVPLDQVPVVWSRVHALQNLKAAPDFEPLAVAFKRVVNIIKKADLPIRKNVNEALFEHESESSLYSAYRGLKEN